MGCCLSARDFNHYQQQTGTANVSRQEIGDKPLIADSKKADAYKQKGNAYFGTGDYVRAVKEYQKAIKQNPSDVRYYNNILVCHRKKEDWKSVCSISQKALELDPENKKSLIFYGIGLAQLSKLQPTSLEKLRMLERAQSIFVPLQFDPQHGKEVEGYMLKVIQLKRYYSHEQNTTTAQEFGEYVKGNMPPGQVPNELKPFYSSHAQLSKQIHMYLSNYINQEIPQYFSDPIDFTIFSKPIISNTGLTYQSTSLFDFFKTNGYMDPITKERVQQDALVENKNLAHYISSHPKITKWKTEEAIQNPRYINF